jgi:hypothetical protein
MVSFLNLCASLRITAHPLLPIGRPRNCRSQSRTWAGVTLDASSSTVVGIVPGSPIVTISFGQERIFRLRPYKARGCQDFIARNVTVFVMPQETAPRADGIRTLGPRTMADVFTTEVDVRTATALMPQAFETSGIILTLEKAD